MSAEPTNSATDTNEAALWDDDGGSSESASVESQPAESTPEPSTAAPTEGRQRDAQGRFTSSAQAQPETRPSADAPTAPAAKTFSVLDRPVTQDDLLRMAEQGELDRWARTASQFGYLQQQYVSQKQELEALRAQAQQAQAAQQQGARQGIQVTPQAIQAYYAPAVNKLVEQGAIEPEAAQLFPMAVSRMLFMDDLRMQTEQRAAIAEQRVSQMEQYLNGIYQGQQVQSAQDTVNRHMQAVAARGDLWGELADANVQGEFLDYLVNKINPPMDMVSEELIAQQFAAFRSAKLVEAAKALKQAQAAQQAQSIQRAVGEGSGSRPAAPSSKHELRDELDEMFSNDY